MSIGERSELCFCQNSSQSRIEIAVANLKRIGLPNVEIGAKPLLFHLPGHESELTSKRILLGANRCLLILALAGAG